MKYEILYYEDREIICNEGCTYLEKRLPMVMITLAEKRLWPVFELRDQPLNTILETMENSCLKQFDEQKCNLKRCGSNCVRNNVAPEIPMLEDQLKEAAKKIRGGIKVLCYHCVRE